MNLKFDTGNAAFEDDNEEIIRILLEVAKKVRQGHEGGLIYDINGNKVGEWWI